MQNVLPESRNKRDPVGGFQGIPVNMTGIASVLKRADPPYETALVGKWDCGYVLFPCNRLPAVHSSHPQLSANRMATRAHTPRGRGYDTWLGYYHHANDYWSQEIESCGLAGDGDEAADRHGVCSSR